MEEVIGSVSIRSPIISMIYAYCENARRSIRVQYENSFHFAAMRQPNKRSRVVEPRDSERSRSRDTIAKTVPFPDRQLRPIMTRAEILQRLQTIKNKETQALKLLESKPLSVVEPPVEISRMDEVSRAQGWSSQGRELST